MANRRFTAAWVVLMLSVFCSKALAVETHPFHISLAEMEFNAETGKFEVALKVHVVDLQSALSRLPGGKAIDLDQGDISEIATRFLDRNFYLLPLKAAEDASQTLPASQGKSPAGKPKTQRSEVTFVGSESKTSWFWLYFELEPPDIEGDFALVNSVFLDSIDKQINTVSIRTGKKRIAMKLTRKEPWQKFPREWLQPAKPSL